MLSNYPPGVSGNEPQIAGPDWEEKREVECDQVIDGDINCEWAGTVDAYGWKDCWYWVCPRCSRENEVLTEESRND
jgi:hypothetical protein